MNKKKIGKVIGWLLFVAWIGFIVKMTLIGRTLYPQRVFRPDLFYEFRELITGAENGALNIKLFFENILLFIPFGMLLPWKKNWWTVLITGCVASALIEITQYVTMLGELEFDDIIANTIGALIGYFLFIAVKKIFYRR